MFDYSFFALLFVVATSLAPASAREVTLVNVNHAEQQVRFTRGDDGRWALHVNEREVGHLERTEDAVLHHTGDRSPDHFPLAELVDVAALRARAARVPLRGSFSRTVLTVERSGGEIRISDPSRDFLMTPLRVVAR